VRFGNDLSPLDSYYAQRPPAISTVASGGVSPFACRSGLGSGQRERRKRKPLSAHRGPKRID